MDYSGPRICHYCYVLYISCYNDVNRFLNHPPLLPQVLHPSAAPFCHRSTEVHLSVELYSTPLLQDQAKFLLGHLSLPPTSTSHPRASLPCHPQPTTQCTSCPLKSRATGLFLPLLTPSVSPSPFAAINMERYPVGPCGFPLPRLHPSASITPVLSPPLPLLTCLPAPL